MVAFMLGDFDYDRHKFPLDDVVLAVALTLGGAVFAAISLFLVRLEKATQPTLSGHVRRCFIFYLSLAILSLVVVQDYIASRTIVSYRQEVATPTIDWLLVLALPILIDALVLLRARRPNRHHLAGRASV